MAGLNILIVDDSAVMRSVLKKILKLTELPVSNLWEAENGQAALEAVDRNWIDLILADLNMPVMGGMEMIRRLRMTPEASTIPVIVISTESSETRISELRDLGIEFIHKPFTPEQVREVVVRMLGGGPRTQSNEHMLHDVAKETLETLAFMPVIGDAVRAPEDDPVAVAVAFRGDFGGTLVLTLPRRLLSELADNMLGEDDGSLAAEQREMDAAGELTNVICGNLLGRVAGRKPVFDLEAPRILEAGAAASGLVAATAGLGIENGWVDLALFLNQ